MPKVSKESAAAGRGPRRRSRTGTRTSTATRSTSCRSAQDIDATPLLKGLPDDRCQCPHWGYVIKGRLTFRFADHEEVFEAGDAFYLPPGHVPLRRRRERVRAVQPDARSCSASRRR